jgi:putative FmdB family regulatory protein
MPIYDYRCTACEADFEMLVRSSTVPTCPRCGSTELQRQLSRVAPPSHSATLIAGARKRAASEGHFSHYSRAEKSKLGV